MSFDWIQKVVLEKHETLLPWFILIVLVLVGYLRYLHWAKRVHREDRKELTSLAIKEGFSLKFKYSWKGVELEITPPTDRRSPKSDLEERAAKENKEKSKEDGKGDRKGGSEEDVKANSPLDMIESQRHSSSQTKHT